MISILAESPLLTRLSNCRAYIDNPDDIYCKPLKCGYDPNTGEWSDWSTNPLKQKVIDFYGMREILM